MELMVVLDLALMAQLVWAATLWPKRKTVPLFVRLAAPIAGLGALGAIIAAEIAVRDAQTALESVPPDQRQETLSRMIGLMSDLRLAAAALLGVGLTLVINGTILHARRKRADNDAESR